MKSKKRLAAEILKTSPQKIKFEEAALAEITKAITRSDIRGLIAVGKISEHKYALRSRAGARHRKEQRRKGRQSGKGSKKGSQFSIVDRKTTWINRIRVQRDFLKELRDRKLLSSHNYHSLYNKSKGGYFRNKRHIKLYLTEHNLIERK